jgi:hypothetical protein
MAATYTLQPIDLDEHPHVTVGRGTGVYQLRGFVEAVAITAHGTLVYLAEEGDSNEYDVTIYTVTTYDPQPLPASAEFVGLIDSNRAVYVETSLLHKAVHGRRP